MKRNENKEDEKKRMTVAVVFAAAH